MAVSQGVVDRLVAVHADLGRVEWAGTKELAETQANHYGIPFRVERKRTATGEEIDLLEGIRRRGKWPSSTTRYCTSDWKRGPATRTITALTPTGGKVLNCFGFRAQESPARKKRPAFSEYNHGDHGATKSRQVFEWLPIHDMLESEVWTDIKASGVPYHSAYDLGMPRLSCVFCIFAPRPALIIAGHANKNLLREYVELEKKMDHTFRQYQTLADVLAAVESQRRLLHQVPFSAGSRREDSREDARVGSACQVRYRQRGPATGCRDFRRKLSPFGMP